MSLGLLLVAVNAVRESTLVTICQIGAHHMTTPLADREGIAGPVFLVGLETGGAEEVSTTNGAVYEFVTMSPLILRS